MKIHSTAHPVDFVPDPMLYTRENPPSNHEFLLFERLPGNFTQKLLSDPEFEVDMPDQYRMIAALSIESFALNAYPLRCPATNQVTVCRHSFLLDSKRPANPCLCLTFHATRNSRGEIGLISLLLYNEFQMPLGVYDHQANAFFVYAQMPHDQSLAFFYKESGDELIHALQRLTRSPGFGSIINHCIAKRALVIGYNKSFGHAHWNDILGYLHLRKIQKYLPEFVETPCVLVGDKAWLEPSGLINGPQVLKNSIDLASDYILAQRLNVYQPLGFRITSDYEKFWTQEVTADASKNTIAKLKAINESHYPIISVNLRFSEWWRRAWRDQVNQVIQIVHLLASYFPRMACVFDGMTAYVSDNLNARQSNYPENFWLKLPPNLGFVDVSGLKIGDKAAAYKLVDYDIAQFGSGSTISAWVYSIPSTCISAEPEIIRGYGTASNITRICKPILQDLDKYGNFLPLESMIIEDKSFVLKPEMAVAYIAAHMRKCGIGDD
jgi:hypothetical protein